MMRRVLMTAAVLVATVVGAGRATHGATPERRPITTQGTIAMRSLDGDLLEAKRRAAEEPSDLGACLRLSALVYQRARITGEIDEMGRALGQTDQCVQRHPESASAWLMRAGQRQTLHRFAEARADLAHARARGGDERAIVSIERELDWNAGLWGPAAAAIREEAARAPTVSSLSRLARLEHDVGRFDAAETHYVRALSLVEDTGPVPVAMIEVQRGMNLSDAGRLDEAEQTFRAAFRRLPQYVAAKEHLAETLHKLGRDDEAIALYESLVRTSADPEFAGALAALLRAKGRIAEADTLRARATRRYEELLQAYPDAMAWHAAEYFAAEGADRARARALLEKNAELRPTPESFEALARLVRSMGEVTRAIELERRARTIRAVARAR